MYTCNHAGTLAVKRARLYLGVKTRSSMQDGISHESEPMLCNPLNPNGGPSRVVVAKVGRSLSLRWIHVQHGTIDLPV